MKNSDVFMLAFTNQKMVQLENRIQKNVTKLIKTNSVRTRKQIDDDLKLMSEYQTEIYEYNQKGKI